MKFLAALIALEHAGFLWLEMFAWRAPLGLRVFRTTAAFAEQTAVLAANQGLYNGFLSAGLFWSLAVSSADQARQQIVHLQVAHLGREQIDLLGGLGAPEPGLLHPHAGDGRGGGGRDAQRQAGQRREQHALDTAGDGAFFPPPRLAD